VSDHSDGRPANPAGPGRCRRHGCTTVAPRNLIVWKCLSGHRSENWYCDGHITEMMDVALRVLNGDWIGRPVCDVCLQFQLPVLELV
jgi:hypothetical protein